MDFQERKATASDAEFLAHIFQLCQIEDDATQLMHSIRSAGPHPSTKLCNYLTSMGVAPQDETSRLPYFVVANSIARQKVAKNGSLTFGTAFASTYKGGRNNCVAQGLWGHMLGSADYKEALISVEMFLLIIYQNYVELDYVRLLDQLRRFAVDRESVQMEWLKEFSGPQRFEQISRKVEIAIPDNALVRIRDEDAKRARWRGKWVEMDKEERDGLFWMAVISNGFSSVDQSNTRNHTLLVEGLGDVIQVTWKERLKPAQTG